MTDVNHTASAPAGDEVAILGYLHEHDAHSSEFSRYDITTDDIKCGWRSTPLTAALAHPRAAVEQCDREAAWPLRSDCYKAADKDAWMAGAYDAHRAIQAMARHRLAALASASAVGGVEILRPLTKEESADLLERSERLWRDLEGNELGGYSGHNRPFYILHAFRQVLEAHGPRDTGLNWTREQIDEYLLTRS